MRQGLTLVVQAGLIPLAIFPAFSSQGITNMRHQSHLTWSLIKFHFYCLKNSFKTRTNPHCSYTRFSLVLYFDTEFYVSPGWPRSPDPHLPPPYCLSNVVITINVCCQAWPLLCENETLTRPGLVCVVFGRWTVQVPCIIVSATTVGQTDDFCASRLSACSWGWITPHNGRVTLDSGCVSFFFFFLESQTGSRSKVWREKGLCGPRVFTWRPLPRTLKPLECWWRCRGIVSWTPGLFVCNYSLHG